MSKTAIFMFVRVAAALVVAAICFSTFPASSGLHAGPALKTEQAQHGNETDSFVSAASLSAPSLSLPAPLQLQPNLHSFVLFEIYSKQQPDEDYTEEASLFPNLLFKVIFRLIISPNGP